MVGSSPSPPFLLRRARTYFKTTSISLYLFLFFLVSFLGLGLVQAFSFSFNALIYDVVHIPFGSGTVRRLACVVTSGDHPYLAFYHPVRLFQGKAAYMPHFHNLPIMPKESKTPISMHGSLFAPYPTPTTAGPRPATVWNAADDDKLLRARASGLNWQPIASQHFPTKSANACRKRHERLIEQRQVSDWDAEKLERLAQEYVAMHKEMWEPLASRMGERWQVVEAKVSITVAVRQRRLIEHSAWKRV